jgi:iron complex outermembrane receptor protein
MKILFGCLVSAFLVSAYSYSCAQAAGSSSAKGKVLTQNNTPADAATVTLLTFPDSAIVKATICGKAGNFEFTGIKPGNYLFLIHKIGYARLYTGQFKLAAGKNTDLGVITIFPLTTELKEVAITDKRDYIEVKPDKTVLNVDRSILAAGNSAFDILNTAPGVRIVDNQILLKGGQKALIAIDGKSLGYMNDEQLAEILKSYQSSMISQVELIENPSAKYDAAGGGGVINIILKKDKSLGFNGSITENAAAGQDYKLNTAINLNYRAKKINFFGSYSFSDNKTIRALDIDRLVDGTALDVNYNSTTAIKNNNFNFGTDYTIATKQTIGVDINGFHSQAGIDKANTTNIINSGQPDTNIITRSHIDRAIININYNLDYHGTFGKGDKTALSANVDYSTYNRHSNELLEDKYYDASGPQPYADSLIMDYSPSSINVRSEKIDFSQALSKTGTLSAGVKNSQVNSDNTIDFEEKGVSDSAYTINSGLTDHFVYNERINAAYVAYNDKFGNSTIALGMRGEQTKSMGISYHPDHTVTSSYFDLLPNLQLTQQLDADNQLTLNYNRRVNRPNYQELNPFVAYIDQYSYSTGNPFLKPEYYNNYTISDLYKDKYKVSLVVQITKDFFVPIFQQNDSTKVFTTTTSNIATRYEYGAEFQLPLDITQWWKINLYLNPEYERYVYGLDSATKTTWDVEVQADQNFTIAKTLKAEVYSSWESPTFYGIKQYKPQYVVNAGISKSILNSNGSIKLAVSDVFNTLSDRYTSNYLNLDLSGREKPGTRFFTATFAYRFGKKSVKVKHEDNTTTEQKRLGGSTNEN